MKRSRSPTIDEEVSDIQTLWDADILVILNAKANELHAQGAEAEEIKLGIKKFIDDEILRLEAKQANLDSNILKNFKDKKLNKIVDQMGILYSKIDRADSSSPTKRNKNN